MASTVFRFATFGAALGVFLGALAVAGLTTSSAAQAAMPSIERPATVPGGIIVIVRDGPRFHHGKRTQAAYCLRRNYWWFYRPYTTAQEDFPRCEPYFHYLEPGEGRRGAYADPDFK